MSEDKKVAEPEKPVIKKLVKIITDAAVVKVGGKYKGRAGVVILNDDDMVMDFYSATMGNVTNNEGEYQAMRLGLNTAMTSYLTEKDKQGITVERHLIDEEVSVELWTDSKLVYDQIMGNCKTKKKSLKGEQKTIKGMVNRFKHGKIMWHRRDRDLAELADFGSKHPRRTKAMFQRMKGQHVDHFVTRAVALTIKDEAKLEKQESTSDQEIQEHV